MRGKTLGKNVRKLSYVHMCGVLYVYTYMYSTVCKYISKLNSSSSTLVQFFLLRKKKTVGSAGTVLSQRQADSPNEFIDPGLGG